jgi:DNA topoisomerase-1
MNNRKSSYIIRLSNINKVMKNKSIPIKLQYIYPDKSAVTDEKLIEYVKSLKIAPGYPVSYVSTNPNSKILAISYDLKGKKQYRYHEDWIKFRTQKKNCGLITLTDKMPRIVRFMDDTLDAFRAGKTPLDHTLEIAVILKIMMECNFRIGNEVGEVLYDSFGLTTLRKKHIDIMNNKIKIEFIGKKGVENICELCNPVLQTVLEELKKRKLQNGGGNSNNSSAPAKNNKNGGYVFDITAVEFNNYLKENYQCTSKDIRSWMANLLFLYYLGSNIQSMKPKDLTTIIPTFNGNNNSKNKNKNKNKNNPKIAREMVRQEKARKKVMKEAIEKTAERLHHTAAICKKSYLFEPILNGFLVDAPRKMIDQLQEVNLRAVNRERRLSSRVSGVRRTNHKSVLVPNQRNKSQLFSTSVVYKNKDLTRLFTEIISKPCENMEKLRNLADFKLPKKLPYTHKYIPGNNS